LEEGAKQWHLVKGPSELSSHLDSRVFEEAAHKAAPGRKILVYLQVILQSVEKSLGSLEN